MSRDVSLSDRKCWNGGHEWVEMIASGLFQACVLGKMWEY